MLDICQRVRIESDVATIRYIGAVEGYGSQVWVGLEWDNDSRGKHDGMVKGKRYFQTRNATGGSLMKIENVPAPLDLLTEIKDRYMADELVDNTIQLNNMSNMKIELIGMEKTAIKQSKIEKLVNIVLDNRCVGYPPPENTPIFIHCRELNLYGNLISKWETVRDILKFFPRISELNLRKNRIGKFENESELYSETVRKLVVSECEIDETSFDRILQCFPNANEVVAFGNGFERIELSEKVASRICSLDLEGNNLKSIDVICPSFLSLTNLNISNCGISKLDKFSRFPKLESLNLRGNCISEWKSVNFLGEVKVLKRLLLNCEHLKCEKGINVFEVIISKIPSLLDLNRFDVSEVERRSAEIRFLNKYANLKNETDHVSDVNRLIKIHGEPTADTAKKGLTVVRIRMQCGDRVETRALPLNMTVQKVTDMVSRLFKVRGSPNIRLYLVMSDDEQKRHRVELDNPLRPFGHYSPSEERDVLILEHD